jgi:hypothetical protein
MESSKFFSYFQDYYFMQSSAFLGYICRSSRDKLKNLSIDEFFIVSFMKKARELDDIGKEADKYGPRRILMAFDRVLPRACTWCNAGRSLSAIRNFFLLLLLCDL